VPKDGGKPLTVLAGKLKKWSSNYNIKGGALAQIFAVDKKLTDAIYGNVTAVDSTRFEAGFKLELAVKRASIATRQITTFRKARAADISGAVGKLKEAITKAVASETKEGIAKATPAEIIILNKKIVDAAAVATKSLTVASTKKFEKLTGLGLEVASKGSVTVDADPALTTERDGLRTKMKVLAAAVTKLAKGSELEAAESKALVTEFGKKI
jgi:hypothetical protein